MKKISYKTIVQNKRLTDFSGFREMVIANTVKNVPCALKSQNQSDESNLGRFE